MSSKAQKALEQHPIADHPLFSAVLYMMYAGDQYKIGITTNIQQRFADIQHGNPGVRLLWRSDIIKLDDARTIEWQTHHQLRDHRIPSKHAREWFLLDSYTVRRTMKDIQQRVRFARNAVLLEKERSIETARLLQTAPDGFISASEYLEEKGVTSLQAKADLTRRAKKITDGWQYAWRPAHQRKDGSIAVRQVIVFHRTIFDIVLVRDAHAHQP